MPLLSCCCKLCDEDVDDVDIKTITNPAYRVCHKCDKNYLPSSVLTVHILRFNTSAQMLLHTL